MSLEDMWQSAINNTEIVRLPVKRLLTYGDTRFEYVFLAPSALNQGDTVVRKGRMDIDKPSLILPGGGQPDFEGFNGDGVKDDELLSFFYTRGVSFPSMKYHNEVSDLDIFEGGVNQAEKFYLNEIRSHERISAGVVVGEESSWQFSVLLLACHMIDNQVDSDMRALLEKIRKKP